MVGVNEPGPEPEGGDPACWAHEFEALLFGETEAGWRQRVDPPSAGHKPVQEAD